MTQTGIWIHNLAKTFSGQKQPALDGLTAFFLKGKRIGIVGPDGAGKTTLLRLLSGLLLPTKGEIKILGVDALKEVQKIHEFIGYMPQKFGLYEDLTVRENLVLYAKLQGVLKKNQEKIFANLLDFSSLEPFQKRLAGDLSGGMKQKLGLCCSLIKKPKILLLDEPTVGVDPLSRRELWQMVSSLLKEDITVLWSTSYLDEAELCDDVLLLHEGKVLFFGPAQDLTKRAAGRVFFISGFLDKRVSLSKLTENANVIDVSVQSSNLRVVLKTEDALDAVKKEIGGIFTKTAPRFEDAFIDLLSQGVEKKPAVLQNETLLSIKKQGAVIEAKNLCKNFGSFSAVKDISFQVKSGEIFGLLGPNGAGKSTTFKMLCGLMHPSKGEAYVSGLSLEKASCLARGRVGYMAQKFSLYGSLSVLQNLSFFAGIYPIPKAHRKQAIDAVVEAFGLAPYLNQTAFDLPLGYKQRLSLSCSLMHNPDVLFLDEPTAGVDPLTRREFWMQINSLVQKGMTVMVTTHFMDEAEYCDRILLIQSGELMHLGSPSELKDLVRSKDLPDPTLEDAFIYLSAQKKRVS